MGERIVLREHREDGIALRPSRPSDFESLLALDRLCFEEGIAYSRQELRRFLEVPLAECVVAESDGAIAGFSVGYVDSRAVAHVVTLDVRPSQRREGLGSRLMESLLERLGHRGARRARLEVDVRNSGAIAFYRKLGFRRTRTIVSYYGPGRDAFEMERPQAASPPTG